MGFTIMGSWDATQALLEPLLIEGAIQQAVTSGNHIDEVLVSWLCMEKMAEGCVDTGEYSVGALLPSTARSFRTCPTAR
jgi:hypothetical protein